MTLEFMNFVPNRSLKDSVPFAYRTAFLYQRGASILRMK